MFSWNSRLKFTIKFYKHQHYYLTISRYNTNHSLGSLVLSIRVRRKEIKHDTKSIVVPQS